MTGDCAAVCAIVLGVRRNLALLVWIATVGVLSCDESPGVAGDGSDAADTASKKVSRLEDQCRKDEPDACNELGAMFLLGSGVAADAKRARELRSRALTLFAADCAGGDESACAHLSPGMLETPSTSDPLPLDAPSDGQKRPVFSVEVHAGGKVMVDATEQTDDELRAVATKRCSKGTRVSIRAASRVTHGRVITEMDTLKQGGCSKIAFATASVAP